MGGEDRFFSGVQNGRLKDFENKEKRNTNPNVVMGIAISISLTRKNDTVF